MATCIVDGCRTKVTKAGHELCYDHWKDDQEDLLWECEKCGKPMDKELPLCSDCYKKKEESPVSRFMTATKVGENVGLIANRVNSILVELGWITKGTGEHGWITTPQGKKSGGVDKEFGTGKTPFVQWPSSLLSNRAFTDAVLELKGEKSSVQEPSSETNSEEIGFREKFPAKLRATDGHMVRSRGELIIDNWLYNSQIIHAYEKKVPIEEDLYCDFYLPTGKVYIEFWGLEDDAAYAKRKIKKLALYSVNNLNLIELKDADIMKIDDNLPPKLRKFNIKVD